MVKVEKIGPWEATLVSENRREKVARLLEQFPPGEVQDHVRQIVLLWHEAEDALADARSTPRAVFVVLDHEDEVMAVFATREAADAYIAVEWADLRPPVLWRVEEFEVRDVLRAE